MYARAFAYLQQILKISHSIVIRTLAELSSSFSFTHFFQMLHGLEEDATGEQHSPKPKMTRVAHSTLVDNPNKMHNLGRSSADEMPLDAPSILRHTAESPNWANAPKVAPTLNLYSKKARPTRRGINQPNVI